MSPRKVAQVVELVVDPPEAGVDLVRGPLALQPLARVVEQVVAAGERKVLGI